MCVFFKYIYTYSIQRENALILCMQTDNRLIAEVPFPPIWVYQKRRSLIGLGGSTRLGMQGNAQIQTDFGWRTACSFAG